MKEDTRIQAASAKIIRCERTYLFCTVAMNGLAGAFSSLSQSIIASAFLGGLGRQALDGIILGTAQDPPERVSLSFECNNRTVQAKFLIRIGHPRVNYPLAGQYPRASAHLTYIENRYFDRTVSPIIQKLTIMNRAKDPY